MPDRHILPGAALALAGLALALPLSPAQAQTSSPAKPGEVMAPRPAAHGPVSDTHGGDAVTAPSGETPRARSARCTRVANQRRLAGSARQEFRLSCMATAAPATHAGTRAPPKPTVAKNELGVATPPTPR